MYEMTLQSIRARTRNHRKTGKRDRSSALECGWNFYLDYQILFYYGTYY